MREAVLRGGLRPEAVEQIIYGMVSLPVGAPNVAREAALQAGLPPTVPATTVSRACISANQAIAYGADQLRLGQARVVLVGGVETLSDVPILLGRGLRDAIVEASTRAKTTADRLRAFRKVTLGDLKPVPPAIAEPSTGESMGEAAEKMAKDFAIARADQDALAARSHAGALAAWDAGNLAAQVVPVPVLGGKAGRLVERDNHPRADSTLEKLARLRPVFDRRLGSVTAGNSSPLTDGASAVVLAAEDVARAEGWPILGFLRAYRDAAVDPFRHLLMGPVPAIARVLADSGTALADVDVFEMHEAFAAQVLANVRGLASEAWCQRELGRSAVGEVDLARVNRWGGSIGLGHPFGATGGRLLANAVHRLRAEDGQLALISACAAGGMGSAMLVERA
jgi:acetyl-CoA acyltransferase